MVFWVFGYGSLMWNPGFGFDERVVGFIKDFRRVFDLACIDHRGTPENPARTCTLERSQGAICWGAAYCIRGGPDMEKSAMEYLERRECEYDRKEFVDFYKEEEGSRAFIRSVMVFTSTPDKVGNKYYLGPAPLEDMAWQIARASGPSGNNREYVYGLEKAMGEIGHEDERVTELAREVRKVVAKVVMMGGGRWLSRGGGGGGGGLHVTVNDMIIGTAAAHFPLPPTTLSSPPSSLLVSD